MKRTRKPELTPRDLGILRYIATYGFASAQSIQEVFWPGQTNRHHFRRISKLLAWRCIEHLWGDGKKLIGYRLTRHGVNVVKSQAKGAEANEFRAAYRTTFDHDHSMQRLGNLFSALRCVSDYLAEPQVRRLLAVRHGHGGKPQSTYKVPDALFTLKVGSVSHRVAVELELSPKSGFGKFKNHIASAA